LALLLGIGGSDESILSLSTWLRTVRHTAAEIISTVERRRRWPAEDKLRIMSEALEPGAVVAAVADHNGVCRSQLYSKRYPAHVPREVRGEHDASP